MPFLYSELSGVISDLMERFVHPSILAKKTSFWSVDLNNAENLLPVNDIVIGLKTRQALTKCGKLEQIDHTTFRKECLGNLESIVTKLLEKSPLKYPFMRTSTFCDPALIINNKSLAKKRSSKLLELLVQVECLSSSEADKIEKEFKSVVETSKFVTKAQVFNREVDRLDDFWVAVIDKEQHTYKGLLNIIKTICICFHGNADVERGFSANKRILPDNQKEKTLISLRHVWHGVHEVGGIQNVILIKKNDQSSSECE
ncbi:hypothetical protein QAD02_002440 [Eretmocerus hayati]|uniref:Uncharacterized protein n=1 Tax=Eretmocerus hayati TaxID=131215 RepID=A0ACC2NJ96_9HYME|nr:hypothetical protein QAD02_002440 [Eretmocerus hayati]